MAIKVSENGRLFTLQTKDSSYQMFADDKNVLLHLYYGEKIGEENLSGLIFCTDMCRNGLTAIETPIWNGANMRRSAVRAIMRDLNPIPVV